MMHAYRPDGSGGLAETEAEHAHWIDLVDPDAGEVAEVSALTGIPLPSRADMEEIEISSRLYHEAGTDFMTLVVPALSGTERHKVAPVTFARAAGRLVTVRYHTPRPFESYPKRAARSPYAADTAQGVLFGLFDAIIDRLADILEITDAEIESVTQRMLRSTDPMEAPDLRAALAALGRAGTLISDVRNSLVTMERAISFLDRKADEADGRALHVLSSDATSLNEHTNFLNQKLSLLLDSAFGLTTIEQNAVTKTFSLVAVLFLPPTLIGAVFGMNFALMPGLDWRLGFPMALAAMALSSALSYLYFRWRNLL